MCSNGWNVGCNDSKQENCREASNSENVILGRVMWKIGLLVVEKSRCEFSWIFDENNLPFISVFVDIITNTQLTAKQ